MNLILFGFKSCGKTTLGKMIAIRMNRPFFDTDHMLEQLHYKLTGDLMHFREIHKRIGEDAFRALEANVVQELKSIKNAVIALGGGAILNPKNAAFLAKLGQLVYLKVSKETLKRRILYCGRPETLNVDSARQSQIEDLRSERRSPAPSAQGEEEDRFDKVAASPNSKFLTARSISQELPSFLNPDDPEGSFEQYYNERKEKYEAISAISIDLETKTQDQVVLELCALILNLEK